MKNLYLNSMFQTNQMPRRAEVIAAAKLKSKAQLLKCFRVLFLLCLAFAGKVAAQSIPVTNPDFENYTTCPTDYSSNDTPQHVVIPGWTQPTNGTSDYLNSCGIISREGPVNQPATIANSTTVSPASGNGYLGVIAEARYFGAAPTFRGYKEYITTELSANMVAGRTYTLSFSLRNSRDLYSPVTTPALTETSLLEAEKGYFGVLFSTTSPGVNDTEDLGNIYENRDYTAIKNSFPGPGNGGRALIPASNPVYSTTGSWTRITLNYTATGGEKYMTIGQFRQGVSAYQTDLRNAYFFIDDVSPYICSVPTVPVLSSTNTTNACPASTANLTTLVTSTAPTESVLEFHTSNVPSADNLVADPTAVQSGTYYAFYKNTVGGCLSAASAAIRVGNVMCPQPDDYIVTANVVLTEILKSNDSNIPAGATYNTPILDPAFTNPATCMPTITNAAEGIFTFICGTTGVFHFLAPVCASGTCINVPLMITVTGTLPVTLISFNATKEGRAVNLTWATTEETNSDRFEIEFGNDGKIWNKVGSVAAAGESRKMNEYSFQHSQPVAGQNLYRLKMLDKDLTFAYSAIRNVSLEGFAKNVIYPNPVTNGKLRLTDWTNVKSLEIYNQQGRRLKTFKSSDQDKMDVSGLLEGLYVIKVIRTNGAAESQSIIISNR